MDLVLEMLPEGTSGEIEIVEHKGLGHPDTMCDALAESFGLALARFYLERFGKLMHFNVDKALLVGGSSEPAFRAGRILAPMEVVLAGRATREVRGVRIPVDELAVETGKAWVRENMHALDPDRHIVWTCRSRGGSSDLVELFAARGVERGASWLANDTSVGAGYAPASPLERAVLASAARLRALSRERPFVGEDVKVMGMRRGDRVDLTVACAFIGGQLADLEEYVARRLEIGREVAAAAEAIVGRGVTVAVNAGDDPGAGRIYLTVTGTSAEAGDDGEVGRGNRVNGLITPFRPMSLEAAAGKNPTSHVGRLYNVAAHRIASAVVEQVVDVAEAHCFLVSRIGHRVDDPVIANLRVRTRDGAPLAAVRDRVGEIVRDRVASLGGLAEEMLAGTVRVF